MTWDDLKMRGSAHYKTGQTEPIDLYRAGGMFRHFALTNIIKYAYRNKNVDEPISLKDLDKIIHYAELLKADAIEVPGD